MLAENFQHKTRLGFLSKMNKFRSFHAPFETSINSYGSLLRKGLVLGR